MGDAQCLSHESRVIMGFRWIGSACHQLRVSSRLCGVHQARSDTTIHKYENDHLFSTGHFFTIFLITVIENERQPSDQSELRIRPTCGITVNGFSFFLEKNSFHFLVLYTQLMSAVCVKKSLHIYYFIYEIYQCIYIGGCRFNSTLQRPVFEMTR